MKFTLSWLKDHLETDADAALVADTLTRIGLEVESVTNPAVTLAPFTVARVLSAERHPQADKLQVLSVDAGDGPMQVVCGAPNARAGMTGVFGPPGAYVPGSGITLKVAAIRGVESRGMMCSARELQLGDEHDGILELPGDAPVGAAYASYAGLDDPLFDISVTPNRQDCMGVRGIARDLAAAGLGTLKPLEVPAVAATGPAPEVRIEDPEGCPAFYARTICGVRNGPSPAWLQQRLKAVGQKPISLLVDITNYVMFDLGRPSHLYDLAKLTGPLTARRARDGEEAVALNGRTYSLTPAMTVIADDQGVHDIAGIMGGEHSGIADDTTDVLLEIAYFTPEHIARTGQALALTSDARTRFERGVDPAFLDPAVDLLTARILELSGGTPSEVARIGQPPLEPKLIDYDPALCQRLGGLDVAQAEQRAILSRLGFALEGWRVTVPSWRRDIDGPADLVEEIVRIVGLDHVQSVPLPRHAGVAKPTATPAQKVEARARRAAAAAGLNEVVTYSFLADADIAGFGEAPWRLANPISEDLKVMRPSLLPGLLRAAQRNAARGERTIRLFELGRRYLPDAERLTLGVVLAGDKQPRDWQAGKARLFDAFDAKAVALTLLQAAGAPVDNLQVLDGAGEAYHPGQSATLRLGPKNVLAAFGMLHPGMADRFDVSGATAIAEIFLDAIPVRRSTGFARPPYAPSGLQPVRRDFAFLVPEALAADTLVRAIKGADKALITSARVFDRFAGAGVPAGQVSLAIELVLQPADKTLDESELKRVSDAVVAAAAKIGASLRV